MPSCKALGGPVPSHNRAQQPLLLLCCHGLLDTLSRAGLGRLFPYGLVGDDDIVEFVLGDDIDGICVCRRSARILKPTKRCHTDANDQRADGGARDGVLDQVRSSSTEESGLRAHTLVIVGGSEWFAA